MADFEHILVSGQSLALGWNSTPTVGTSAETANARRIAPGDAYVSPMTGENSIYPGWQMPEFTLGHRVAAAAAGSLVGVSTHGTGGARIAILSKGGSTGKYEQAVSCVGSVKTARTGLGETYNVRALHWIQGETDQNESMSAATYLAALTDLIDDYRTDLPSASALPVILSQTSMTYNLPATVAIAQLAAARTLTGVYVACSHYHLPHLGDQIHLTNVGSYRLGEYHARAHNAVKSGAGWKPFAPHTITAAGNSVVIDYDVPVAPLVFDTTGVPAQANMGFTLSGTAATITGVAITGPAQVTLTTSAPLSGTITVGYASDLLAYEGRGNLRDSETATSGYDGTALPNWSLIFRESVTVAEPVGLRTASAAYVKVGSDLLALSAPA